MSHTTYRNRHERGTEHHFGDLSTTFVELTEAIGALPAGSTVEALLTILDSRLSVLENTYRISGSFSASAIIMRTRLESWVIDAWLESDTVPGSFTVDSIIRIGQIGSFTASAVAKRTLSGLLTVDAIAKRVISGSASADAIIRALTSGSLTVDAWLLGKSFSIEAILTDTLMGSFTIDAVIGDSEARSNLGEITLGDDTLGDTT